MEQNVPPHRNLYIIPRQRARGVIPKIKTEKVEYFYLSNDYEQLIYLRNKFDGQLTIRTLGGLFQKMFAENKRLILDEFLKINKKHNSFEWWGNQIASKSTPATPLMQNIVYLLCAKRIISEHDGDIVFIMGSSALARSISEYGKMMGENLKNYYRKIDDFYAQIRLFCYYLAQIAFYLVVSLKNRRDALKVLKPFTEKRTKAKKRVVIRTWMTDNTFDESGKFKDRNFGALPDWLRSQGYEVWTLPMFFNLKMSRKEIYKRMLNIHEPLLIPDHYLRFSDYISVLWRSYLGFRKPIMNVKIQDLEVSPIFNEVLRKLGFNVGLCLLNACVPMLKRLKELNFEISGFYYPFECNAPENQFILGCRRYFPDSEIIGFQHTTFFPNQLAYHLTDHEAAIHPLPDKIICSGPVYKNLHKNANFPEGILMDGPNLRFASVYKGENGIKAMPSLNGDKKNILLPLTFSCSLAFDLFMKVNEALEGKDDYRIYIRPHPLLSDKRLKDFLDKIQIDNYVFANEGSIQEWLPKMHAVISTGGTITILEAIAYGTPVIRVIPDNTFYFDPCSTTDYPLQPVNTSLEIRQQLCLIEDIKKNGNGVFTKVAKEVLRDYFPKPNEENLSVFL